MTLEQKIKATEDYFKESNFKYWKTIPRDDRVDQEETIIFKEKIAIDDSQTFSIISRSKIKTSRYFQTAYGEGFHMKWALDLFKIWGGE